MKQDDTVEITRLVALIETLTEPLEEAGFETFLIYVKAVVAVSKVTARSIKVMNLKL